jgi:hypothetical protein
MKLDTVSGIRRLKHSSHKWNSRRTTIQENLRNKVGGEMSLYSTKTKKAKEDLDGAQSVKTMHEANNYASADPSQESSKRVRNSNKSNKPEKSITGSSGSSVVLDEGRVGKQSGDTPISVGVRIDKDSQDMEYSTEDSASGASTASAADSAEVLPGTTG